jgi:hypothetical protein
MALSKTVSLDNGLPDVADAYVRIDTQSGSKDSITISVNAYVSKTIFQAGNPYIKPTQIFTFIPSVADGSTNFIEQGYEYLKTIDEFSDATDC